MFQSRVFFHIVTNELVCPMQSDLSLSLRKQSHLFVMKIYIGPLQGDYPGMLMSSHPLGDRF